MIIYKEKQMKQKLLSEKSGFTITEMLACMLIMMLATGTILQTMNLAYQQFQDQTEKSEARLLANSLSLAIQSQLTYAKKSEEDGGTIIFTGNRTTNNVKYKIRSTTDSDSGLLPGVLIMDYYDADIKTPLISQNTYGTSERHFTAKSIMEKDVDDDSLFHVQLKVFTPGDQTNPAAESTFTVHSIGM